MRAHWPQQPFGLIGEHGAAPYAPPRASAPQGRTSCRTEPAQGFGGCGQCAFGAPGACRGKRCAFPTARPFAHSLQSPNNSHISHQPQQHTRVGASPAAAAAGVGPGSIAEVMGRRGRVSPVCNRATPGMPISLGRFVSIPGCCWETRAIQSPAQPRLPEAQPHFPHPGPWRATGAAAISLQGVPFERCPVWYRYAVCVV